MNKFLSIIFVFFAIASCVPPGKLSEVIDTNNKLNSRYDSLSNKLKDTIANYSNSVLLLNNHLITLKDSLAIYQRIANKPIVLTDGDIILNNMLNLSLIEKASVSEIKNTSNDWIIGFKEDIKKYTGNDAVVKLNNGFIFVDISDKILFNSGSQTISNKSKQIIKRLDLLLKAQPSMTFIIEGHTDNKIYKGKGLNDNWSLSLQRATALARLLQTKYKVDPRRIIAAGRSQYMPIDDNNTKAGRLNNRRIHIILMPGLNKVINFK